MDSGEKDTVPVDASATASIPHSVLALETSLAESSPSCGGAAVVPAVRSPGLGGSSVGTASNSFGRKVGSVSLTNSGSGGTPQGPPLEEVGHAPSSADAASTEVTTFSQDDEEGADIDPDSDVTPKLRTTSTSPSSSHRDDAGSPPNVPNYVNEDMDMKLDRRRHVSYKRQRQDVKEEEDRRRGGESDDEGGMTSECGTWSSIKLKSQSNLSDATGETGMSKIVSWNSHETRTTNPLSISSDQRRTVGGVGSTGDISQLRTTSIPISVTQSLSTLNLTQDVHPEIEGTEMSHTHSNLSETSINSNRFYQSSLSPSAGLRGGNSVGRSMRKARTLRNSQASQDSLYELAGETEGGIDNASAEDDSLSTVNPKELRELIQNNHLVETLCCEGARAGRDSLDSEVVTSAVDRVFVGWGLSSQAKLTLVFSPFLLLTLGAVATLTSLASDELFPGLLAGFASTALSLCLLVVVFYCVSVSVDYKRQCISVELDRKLEMEQSALRFAPQEFISILEAHSSNHEIVPGHHVTLNVAILCSDIRDFTKISESLEIAEAFDWVSTFAERMVPVIRNNEGFVNQYLGDGILAIFRKCDLVVNASVQMQLGVDEMNTSQKRHKIVMGVGIHWGPVTFGSFGDEMRIETALLGKAVNVADLVEDLTKSYRCRILLTEPVHHQLSLESTRFIRRVGLVALKHARITALFDVFKSDPDHIVTYKMLIREAFDTALADHIAGNFHSAKEGFAKCLEMGTSTSQAPVDPLVTIRLYLVWDLCQHPPASAWDGVDEW